MMRHKFDALKFSLAAVLLIVSVPSSTVKCQEQEEEDDASKNHICHYLKRIPQEGESAQTRIPLAAVFNYPKLKHRLLLMDYNNVYYDFADSSSSAIQLPTAEQPNSKAIIDLQKARVGMLSWRWAELTQLPAFQYADAVMIGKNKSKSQEPYLCFHNNPGGKCYSLLKENTTAVDCSKEILKHSTKAKLVDDLANHLSMCLVRSTVKAKVNSFTMIFRSKEKENEEKEDSTDSPFTYSESELECDRDWREDQSDPTPIMFRHGDSVLLINTFYAYIFSHKAMKAGGKTEVIRVPLKQMFKCDPKFIIKKKASAKVLLLVIILIMIGVQLVLIFYLWDRWSHPIPRRGREQKRARKRSRSSRKRKKEKEESSDTQKSSVQEDEEADDAAPDASNTDGTSATYGTSQSTSGQDGSIVPTAPPLEYLQNPVPNYQPSAPPADGQSGAGGYHQPGS